MRFVRSIEKAARKTIIGFINNKKWANTQLGAAMAMAGRNRTRTRAGQSRVAIVLAIVFYVDKIEHAG